MNGRFEVSEQICTVDTSCLPLMMHFAISFMYMGGKILPHIIYLGESTVISISFIIANSNCTVTNCNLLWEGVTCDTSQHFDLIQSFVITTSFLGIFSERASGAHCNVSLLILSPEDVRLP